jgi:hypothetical protein
MTLVFAFGVGLVSGWAVRSLADSPQAVGVKLLEIGLNTKERVDRWAAVERDRLDDMLAEARSRVTSSASTANGAANGSGHRARTTSEDA